MANEELGLNFGRLVYSAKPSEDAVKKPSLFSFLSKAHANEVDVYENGIRLKSKIGERTLHYSEFLGIYDSIHKHSENGKSMRDFQVEVKDEDENALVDYLNWNDVNDFAGVANAITDTYTDFLLNGATRETLTQIEIRFDDDITFDTFRLKNGNFCAGHVREMQETIEIPAENITSVDISPGWIKLKHLVNGKEEIWKSFPLNNIFNINALHIIVNDILKQEF
ncbi:MAG: hypothetical protein FWG65_06095 [Turicibacter sp.]|nr:hypothetical protein [Turicibacter sp.]